MSACTGAEMPSSDTFAGTSCTCPSVIRMTPASRFVGISASAFDRSPNNRVPSRGRFSEAPGEATFRTSTPESFASRRSSASATLALSSARPPSFWLALSSLTTTTTSLKGSRSTCCRLGLKSASSSRANAAMRNRAPRGCRQSSSAASTRPKAPSPPRTAPGSRGSKISVQDIAVYCPSRSSSAGT